MIFANRMNGAIDTLKNQKASIAVLATIGLVITLNITSYLIALATIATISLAAIPFTLWRINTERRKDELQKDIDINLKYLVEAKLRLDASRGLLPTDVLELIEQKYLNEINYNTNPKMLVREIAAKIQKINEFSERKTKSCLRFLWTFTSLSSSTSRQYDVYPFKIYQEALDLHFEYLDLTEIQIEKEVMVLNLMDKKKRNKALERLSDLMQVDRYRELQQSINAGIEKLSRSAR